MEVGEGCCVEHGGVGGGGARLKAWVRGCEESGWLRRSDAKAIGPEEHLGAFLKGQFLISFSFLPWVYPNEGDRESGIRIQVPRSPSRIMWTLEPAPTKLSWVGPYSVRPQPGRLDLLRSKRSCCLFLVCSRNGDSASPFFTAPSTLSGIQRCSKVCDG